MSTTSQVTVRANSDVKKKAKEFLNSMWISLSAWVNMFLADLAYNKRLSFEIDSIELTEVSIENLPPEVRADLEEMENMNREEFISL